jgi:hypothetical protein
MSFKPTISFRFYYLKHFGALGLSLKLTTNTLKCRIDIVAWEYLIGLQEADTGL